MQIEEKQNDVGQFLKSSFEVILQRPIDQEAFEYYKTQLLSGTLSKVQFVETLFNSIEFQMVKSDWNNVVHAARCKFISGLPEFKNILDIGGSSSNIKEGALIELGYKNIPNEIDILDLPEEEQYWGSPKYSQDKDYWILNDKCRIHFEHGKAENIEKVLGLKGKQYDMIFMGEVIEHIEPGKIVKVFNWIHDALVKKNNSGYFIFDTPNRIATKLINPTGYIDNDHKKEYTPNELRHLLKKANFKIVEEFGLVNLYISISHNKFMPTSENFFLNRKSLIDKNADNGYLFAFICKAY